MMLSAAEAPYQSCYCEENAYKLLEKCEMRDGMYVVMVSSDDKIVTLFAQKSAPPPYGAVIWDYHVFVVHKSGTEVKVYDHDSSLDWGVDFLRYWAETMKPVPVPNADRFCRRFRVVPADVYLKTFSSDRSHMLNGDGEFIKPPPAWPLINPRKLTNLMNLLRFSENIKDTTVMNEQQMVEFFST